MTAVKRRKPISVIDYCVARHGVHKGAFVAAHVAQWAIVSRELGHVATTVEYSEYWFCDERSGWRHRADIASVFGEEWPRVVEAVAAEIDGRLSPRAVSKLTVPAFAFA